MSDVLDFYHDLLPPGQPITASVKGKKGAFNIRAHADIDALPDHFSSIEDANLYFALGTYQRLNIGLLVKPVKNGLFDSPIGGRAWGFDLDVGEGKFKFKSLKAAAKALSNAISEGKIPNPSWIVQSGGGLQFFYVLPEGELLSEERWTHYFYKLKALMFMAFGKKIDPKPGSTLHSWFRAPDTWNVNYGKPRRTKIAYEGEWVDEESLADWVSDVEPIKKTKKGKHFRTDSTVSASDRVDTHTIKEACAFMRKQHETGGLATIEPDWCMTANIAAHTLGTHLFFHECSVHWRDKKSGERYDHDDAQDKYDGIYNTASAGPWGCDQVVHNDVCKKCWVKQKDGLNNPISAARYWDKNGPQFYDDDPAPEEPETEEIPDEPITFDDEAQMLDQDTTEIQKEFEFNLHDMSFRQDIGLGDYDIDVSRGMLTHKGHDVGDYLIPQGTFFNDNKDDEVTVYIGKPGKMKRPMPAESLGNAVTTQRNLTRVGLKCFNGDRMSEWLQKLAFDQDQMVRECDQMGWSTDQKTFFSPNGTLKGQKVFPSIHVNKVVHKWGGQKGTVNGWMDSIQMLNSPSQLPVLATLLASLASPLLAYLDMEKGLVFALEGAPGIGKSTAMSLGNSVWGKPIESLARFNDSALALPRIVGAANNLPAVIDEYTTEEPKELRQWAFDITQGEYRTTLTKERDFRKGDSWQTILMTSGNTSFMGLLNRTTNTSGADLSRVFEMQMNRVEEDLIKGDKLKRQLKKHYGVFGQLFITTLTSRPRSHWRKVAAKQMTSLKKHFGVQGDDRFGEAFVVAANIAHRVAKEAHPEFPGDVNEVYQHLVSHLQAQQQRIRTLVQQNRVSAPDFILDFINNKNINVRKSVDAQYYHYHTDGHTSDTVFEYAEGTYIVPVNTAKAFCTKHRIDYNNTLQGWIDNFEVLAIDNIRGQDLYEAPAHKFVKGFQVNNTKAGQTKVIIMVPHNHEKVTNPKELKRRRLERKLKSGEKI